MKITDSEIIKSGERELMDTIIGDLDWSVIEQVVKEKHNLGLQDDVEYKHGDIVVHNNQVAYQLDFNVKVTLSVLFDRNGEYLSLTGPADLAESPEQTDKDKKGDESVDIPEHAIADESRENNIDVSSLPETDVKPNETISKMASQIADMITDINER